MNITGIIAEYNPFHNGHLYHLQQAKKITTPDLTIVVMSGSFVQRGTPAVLDKWTRTKMALLAGADVVIELPTIFAVSSAVGFARGAILLLKTAGATSFVCGVESIDDDVLKQIAKISLNEPPAYKKKLHATLKQGYSFAKAHAEAISAIVPAAEEALDGSNNILAINYLRAIDDLDASIQPIFIQRQGSGYHSTELSNYYASATAIRKALPDLASIKAYMPDMNFDLLSNEVKSDNWQLLSDYSQLILGILRRADLKSLTTFPEMEVGMPELFLKNARNCSDINIFIESCTSRRYPASRIRRMLLYVLLNVSQQLFTKSLTLTSEPYLRILGFRQDKSSLIKAWRTKITAAVVQRPARFFPTDKTIAAMWELDLRATDLYCLFLADGDLNCQRQDFCHPLIIV